MSKIRSKDTGPEVRIRKYLHSKGLRYRLHVNKLPGKPDIVFQRYRAAIQVRGCFWHQHTCRDGRVPASRREYWVPKFERTAKRDRANDRKLVAAGWRLWVVWECEIRSEELLKAIGDLLYEEIVSGQ